MMNMHKDVPGKQWLWSRTKKKPEHTKYSVEWNRCALLRLIAISFLRFRSSRNKEHYENTKTQLDRPMGQMGAVTQR